MAELLKPGDILNVEYKYMTYTNNDPKGPLTK